MSEPNLVLLPWVRRGGPLDLPPDEPGTHPASQVSSTAGVRVNGVGPASVPVRLLGPGDVTGLARQQVIRTDPAPGSRTFESNYLAQVELDEPALPWLFTPASASEGRLRPWLCLVVVREQPGVQLSPPGRGALPVLRIGPPARAEDELPDLDESWAWAHAQLATDAPMTDPALAEALAGDPARSLSRLVCGRLLSEQTEYLACVVPTFEAGRLAGLGEDPGEAQGPAWEHGEQMAPVELPVLYHWRFATGPAGDFQSLALAIRGRPVAEGFGTRPVDLSTSGLGVSDAEDAQVLLAGALVALGPPVRRWPDPALRQRFADALTGVLNVADQSTAAPVLAPPRYGSRYAPEAALDPGAAGRWYEQLNTDPANRVAAALGTLVVQQQQETLVAAAWDQAADLQAAGRVLGLTGLGLALADSLHRRHLEPLAPEAGLFVLAPLRARLLSSPATGTSSFAEQWARSGVPTRVLSPAVRRVTRSRGPAVRRTPAVAVGPTATPTVAGPAGVAAAVSGAGPAGPRPTIDVLATMARLRLPAPVPAAPGPLTFEGAGASLPTPRQMTWAQVDADAVTGAPPRSTFRIGPTPAPSPRPVTPPLVSPPRGSVLGALPGVVAATDTSAVAPTRLGGVARLARPRPDDPTVPHDPLPPIDPPDPDPPVPPGPPRPRRDNAAAAAFRRVASRHLAAFLPPEISRPRDPGVLVAGSLFAEALTLTAPARTFAAGVAGIFREPPASGDGPVPSLQLGPRFSTPMSRALVELGQQWLLPGLDGVPADTALALRTNAEFVEAFMVGLNHELGRELLWREFPTPLTATFFDRFWDAAVAPDAPPDIPELASWGGRALGAPTVVEERFVLLLRSELIKRFPDALVSAVLPGPPTEELLPVFRGSMDPDISYFGFAVPLADVDEVSVVIAEQPGAPRFGFEVGEAPQGVTHAPATEATAAAQAARLRQLPARITIPASVLLRRPTP